jgi:NAD(P)-dependent dehydrogenase (short-subunit alcohol dehydrogenase family)
MQFQQIQKSMPKISNMGQMNQNIQAKAGARASTVMMAGPTVSGSTPDMSENHMDKEMSTHARDRFHGKTIVITGGAGDFGMNCGLRMASEGANVAILDIVEDKLDEAAEKIRAVAKGDAKVMVATADVTKPEAVEEAFKKVAAEFGDIHYVFNNAGYQGDLAMVQNYSEPDFQRVLNINVMGVFNVLKAASNHMIERGIKGSIVNTASKAATNCPPNMPAYAASKGAVWAFSQSSAKDLAPHGIRVNSLSPAFIGPGFMWTRQTEL